MTGPTKKTLGIIVLVFAVTSGAVHAGGPKTRNVNVVNTPDVSVVNMPSVNVANEPTVNVGNTPLPVTVENGGSGGTGEYRFVGFSSETETRLGNAGLKGMHEACQNTFSAESRMCFTDEVMASPEITSVSGAPPDGAWANDKVVGANTVFPTTTGEPGFAGISGLWGKTLNCNGWNRSLSSGGVALTGVILAGSNLHFELADCINSTPRRVACCGPTGAL